MTTAKLLIVDDEKDLLQLLVKRLKRKGYDVEHADSAEEALSLLTNNYYDIGVFDIRLPKKDGISLLKETKIIQPDMQIIMLTGHGTIETAIEAMKYGAFDYLTKPYNLSELELIIQKARENKSLKDKNESMRKLIKQQNQFHIVGESSKLQEVVQLTKRIADSEVPVLIEGESGTGKELFAKALHYWSNRREEPFVALNSGAISETLLESELFGHAKGAFTGANQEKKGLVEVADGGTLFLDELGEMPQAVQVKLLRFLESGEFRRVGDIRQRRVKVRVVAATNRQMEKEVEEGNFREDLYYRLNVVKLYVPPLRERIEDIPVLIRFFIEKAKKTEKIFSDNTIKQLESYPFPGNVRELQHLIERGLLLSKGNIVEVEDLLLSPISSGEIEKPLTLKTLEELEMEHIEKALHTLSWNKTKAAEALGISVRNLYRKIEQYNLTER
ncbi:sigma-54 dependent transcriptional regulator [Cytobacillus spongiae]|uniref:sigma-54-dependent transcriptional regulator n=1 Tax=Cytobacillus spongiae TaxID=2901381 RepID=UPI001F34BB54|nr:sigma-54 dependent transcriptional regulator [Cytobacillus spongiae]UII56811.1 sigma-54 dependent transcriptional regulator [Cytobacillus spongiae]